MQRTPLHFLQPVQRRIKTTNSPSIRQLSPLLITTSSKQLFIPVQPFLSTAHKNKENLIDIQPITIDKKVKQMQKKLSEVDSCKSKSTLKNNQESLLSCPSMTLISCATTQTKEEIIREIANVDDQIKILNIRKQQLEVMLFRNLTSSFQSQDIGMRYEGSYKYGKRDGYGMLYGLNDCLLYEGQWKCNQFEGRGKLQNPLHDKDADYDVIDQENVKMWQSYEGEFLEGQFCGMGCLNLSNGLKYHGMFDKGKAQGRGTILSNKMVILMGDFEEGVITKVLHQSK